MTTNVPMTMPSELPTSTKVRLAVLVEVMAVKNPLDAAAMREACAMADVALRWLMRRADGDAGGDEPEGEGGDDGGEERVAAPAAEAATPRRGRKSRTVLDDAMLASIKADYEAGAEYASMQARYDIDRHTVLRRAKKHGWKKPRNRGSDAASPAEKKSGVGASRAPGNVGSTGLLPGSAIAGEAGQRGRVEPGASTAGASGTLGREASEDGGTAPTAEVPRAVAEQPATPAAIVAVAAPPRVAAAAAPRPLSAPPAAPSGEAAVRLQKSRAVRLLNDADWTVRYVQRDGEDCWSVKPPVRGVAPMVVDADGLRALAAEVDAGDPKASKAWARLSTTTTTPTPPPAGRPDAFHARHALPNR